jgi:hypothetical protein
MFDYTMSVIILFYFSYILRVVGLFCQMSLGSFTALVNFMYLLVGSLGGNLVAITGRRRISDTQN